MSTIEFKPSYDKYMTAEAIADAARAVEKKAHDARMRSINWTVEILAKKIDALLSAPEWSDNKTCANPGVAIPLTITEQEANRGKCDQSNCFKVEAHKANKFESYLINRPIIVCYVNATNLDEFTQKMVLGSLIQVFSKLHPVMYTFSNNAKGLIIQYPSENMIKKIRSPSPTVYAGATGPSSADAAYAAAVEAAATAATAATTATPIALDDAKKTARDLINSVPKAVLDYTVLCNTKNHTTYYRGENGKTVKCSEITVEQFIDYFHSIGVTKYDYLKQYFVRGQFIYPLADGASVKATKTEATVGIDSSAVVDDNNDDDDIIYNRMLTCKCSEKGYESTDDGNRHQKCDECGERWDASPLSKEFLEK